MNTPGLYTPREATNQAWRVPARFAPWDSDEFEAVLHWIDEHGGRGRLTRHVGYDGLTHWFDLATVDGRGRAHPGTWIVLGPAGFFIRADEQFHADYVAA